MKKLVFLSLIVLGALSVACKDNKEPAPGTTPDGPGFDDRVFVKSYIRTYVEAPWVGRYYVNSEEGACVCLIPDQKKVVEYTMPELMDKTNPAYEERVKKYLEIAERNGDRSYDAIIHFTTFNSLASVDNYKSVHVVCLNNAWDAAHPAGTSLDDLVTIRYYTKKDFIRNNYQIPKEHDFNGEGIQYDATRMKRLTELTESDLAIIIPELQFFFDTWPAKGGYDVQFTLTTTDGEEQVTVWPFWP